TLLYNFENEKLPTLVLDYNEKSKLLFLSQEQYNSNWDNPQAITIIRDNNINQLSGLYKEVKISNSGNYFLTISENDLAEIFDANLKKIYEQKLTKGRYIVHPLDANH